MKKNNFIFFFYSSILFFILLITKYYYLEPQIPAHDQVFYINWIQSLREVKSFFPSGEGNIIENIYEDHNSALNQIFRRFYNNFSAIFASFSLLLFYFLSFFFGNDYLGFFNSSILISSLIPFFISLLFFANNDSKTKFLLTLFLYFTYFANFSFFHYSGLGVHNVGILFFLIALFYFKKNLNKDIFFDKKLILLGIIFPLLSHSFNLITLTPILILILIYRKYFLKKKLSSKEYFFINIFYITIIFTVTLIIIINPFNIRFITNFLNLNSSNSIEYFFKDRFESLIFLSKNIFFLFEYIQIIFIFLFFFIKKNNFYKIVLLILIFIYTLLTLNGYQFGPLLYIASLFNLVVILNFTKILNTFFNNEYLKKIILLSFAFSLMFALYTVFFQKNLNYHKNIFNKTYHLSDKKFIKQIKEIGFYLEDKNKIFNSYLAKNLYYSINSNQITLDNIKALDTYGYETIYNDDLYKNTFVFFLSEKSNFDCSKNYEIKCQNFDYILDKEFKDNIIYYANRKYYLHLYYIY